MKKLTFKGLANTQPRGEVNIIETNKIMASDVTYSVSIPLDKRLYDDTLLKSGKNAFEKVKCMIIFIMSISKEMQQFHSKVLTY